MKMAKKIVLAAVVLPLTLGSAAVFAAGGGKGQGRDFRDDCGRGGMMNPTVFTQLNVTPEQKSKMAELRLQQRDAMQAQRGARHAEMQAFKAKEHALVMASNFDEAAANKLAKQMVEQRAQQRVAMMKQRHEMMNVLSADQKAQLTAIQKERMTECVLFGHGKGQGQGQFGGKNGSRGMMQNGSQGMMQKGPQGQPMLPMGE